MWIMPSYCLDARSQLNEPTRGDFRIGEAAFGDEFHCWNQNLDPMLGLTCPRLLCQFGTICTDPAAPHSEQTDKPMRDQG